MVADAFVSVLIPLLCFTAALALMPNLIAWIFALDDYVVGAFSHNKFARGSYVNLKEMKKEYSRTCSGIGFPCNEELQNLLEEACGYLQAKKVKKQVYAKQIEPVLHKNYGKIAGVKTTIESYPRILAYESGRIEDVVKNCINELKEINHDFKIACYQSVEIKK